MRYAEEYQNLTVRSRVLEQQLKETRSQQQAARERRQTAAIVLQHLEDEERAAATRLGDTGGVASDAEESLEEVIRRAKKTPRFWSGDNPVLVGASLSLLSAAVAGAITGQ